MPLVQAYKDFIRVGKESAWGTVATAFQDIRARPWDFQNRPTRAFPEGERVGVRDMDTTRSVPGRRFSEGNMPTYWRPDTGGLMLLAAMGSEVVAADPGTAVSRKKHTIRCADFPPSLTVQNFQGAKVAGVDQAYEHKGVTVDSFTINWDATDDAGILEISYRMIGLYGERIAKPAFAPSAWSVTPNWSAALERDSVANCRIQQMSLTFENNVARVKAGCGTRDDQDRQLGGRRVSGTMTFIYDDETEYDLFEGAGEEDISIVFTDTHFIETVTAVDYFGGLELHMPHFCFAEYTREERDGYKTQRIGFRAYRDDTIGGPMEAIVYNDEAAYA